MSLRVNEVGILLGRSLLGRVDVEMGSLKLSSLSIPCHTLEGFHTPSENTKHLIWRSTVQREYKKWNFRVRTCMPLTFNILRSDCMSSFWFSCLLAVNECSLCTTSLPIFKKIFANLMGVTCYLFIILKFTFSSLLLTLSFFLYICWPFSFSLLQITCCLFCPLFYCFLMCVCIFMYIHIHTYFYLYFIFYLYLCFL